MDTALYVIFFFSLAFVGSLLMDLFHRRFSVKRILHLLGIEYIFLGIIIGPKVLGLIDEKILTQLKPLVGLAIGWVGLLFGAQLNFNSIKRFPGEYIKLSFFQGLGTYILTIGFSLGAIFFWNNKLGFESIQPVFILAAISVCTSPIVIGYLSNATRQKGRVVSLIHFISSTDGAWSIITFGIAYALVLPREGALSHWTYDLVRAALSLSIGASMGYFFRMLLRQKYTHNEFLLLLVGLVIFSSGAASFLGLSPILVNFIIGLIIGNTHEKKSQVLEVLVVYEKIFYIIFLVLAGCLWSYPGYWIIIIALFYIIIRALGKVSSFALGSIILRGENDLKPPHHLGLAFLPQGGMALAMAIDYLGNYPGQAADIILNLVLVSVVLSHIFSPSIIRNFIVRESI